MTAVFARSARCAPCTVGAEQVRTDRSRLRRGGQGGSRCRDVRHRTGGYASLQRCRGFRGPDTQKSRRRPIFPKGCPLSIFGAGELDFRVRDGNGYGLSARVTGIRCVWTCRQRHAAGPRRDPAGAGRDLRSRMSRQGSITIPATDPWSVAEEVKPSTVSTAQLHPSPDFHMRPIEQVVSLRSYPVDPVGNLISRRASHLDAFSAYPDRT
jgi:hypothetical protein